MAPNDGTDELERISKKSVMGLMGYYLLRGMRESTRTSFRAADVSAEV
jgi:hypothetical protein